METLKEITELPQRLYAIGDIHGCQAEIGVLLDYLRQSERISDKDLVVLIGDYIDRGPNSKGVIDLLVEFQKEFPSTIFLRGNHEDMLLNFMGVGGSQGLIYLVNGGTMLLQSYGLPIKTSGEALFNVLPEEHRNFLRNLTSYVKIGDYIFCHAGLDPSVGVAEQDGSNLFWVRDSFILNPHDLGLTVVFGHTPFQEIFFDLPWKIGIDTGLVYKNILSCIELTERKTFQVNFGSTDVHTGVF